MHDLEAKYFSQTKSCLTYFADVIREKRKREAQVEAFLDIHQGPGLEGSHFNDTYREIFAWVIKCKFLLQIIFCSLSCFTKQTSIPTEAPQSTTSDHDVPVQPVKDPSPEPNDDVVSHQCVYMTHTISLSMSHSKRSILCVPFYAYILCFDAINLV